MSTKTEERSDEQQSERSASTSKQHDALMQQIADSSSEFYSMRSLPWGALGEYGDGTEFRTDEPLTAEQALAAASLAGWDVHKQPLHIDNGERVPGKFATVRTDPKTGKQQPLGVVGNVWRPVQNEDAFAFLDNLVDEAGGAHYESAFPMRGYTRVVVTLRLPRGMQIGGADPVDTYLLCSNSFDGTSPFTVAATSVRRFCTNVLNYALRDAQQRWSVRHTKSAKGRVQEARETLQLAWEAFDAFEREAQALYEKSVTDKQFDNMTKRLIPLAGNASERQRSAVERTRAEVRSIYHDAATQQNIKGTAWGAVQAFAEWSDWARSVRPREQMPAVARATRVLEGTAGPTLKRRAVDAALALR